MAGIKIAQKGKHFVLTEKGYKKTPDNVKPERSIGKPLKGFEYSVPTSWFEKGYVEEVDLSEFPVGKDGLNVKT